MTGRRERTFLVESYVPRLDERAAATISSRFREAARELGAKGVEIQWCGSFVLIGEETYLCIVAAPDLDAVVQLNERAGIGCHHMVEVVPIDPFVLPDPLDAAVSRESGA